MGDTYVASDILAVQILNDKYSKDSKKNTEFDVNTVKANLMLDREKNKIMTPQQKTANLIIRVLIDITKQAEEGKLDPVIGRDTEIRRTIQVLQRLKIILC